MAICLLNSSCIFQFLEMKHGRNSLSREGYELPGIERSRLISDKLACVSIPSRNKPLKFISVSTNDVQFFFYFSLAEKCHLGRRPEIARHTCDFSPLRENKKQAGRKKAEDITYSFFFCVCTSTCFMIGAYRETKKKNP